MKFKQFFCSHEWEFIAAYDKIDLSFGSPGVNRTDVYMHCPKCEKIHIESIEDVHIADDLNNRRGAKTDT